MKKSMKLFAALSLAGTMLLSSCIGSFALFNRLKDWNNNLSNKAVNEIVFFAFNIIPVYEIAYLADVLVINSIEFWSGSNPVADNSGVINTDNGQYVVEQNENGYTITNDGQTVSFVKDGDSWYYNENGNQVKMFEFVDEQHVQLNDGSVVELSQVGIENLRAQYCF